MHWCVCVCVGRYALHGIWDFDPTPLGAAHWKLTSKKKRTHFPPNASRTTDAVLGAAHSIAHTASAIKGIRQSVISVSEHAAYSTVFMEIESNKTKKKRKTCAAFNEKKAHEKKKVKQKKPGFFPSSFIYVHWSFFLHSFRFFFCCFEAVLPGCWCSSVVDAAAAAYHGCRVILSDDEKNQPLGKMV